MLLPQTVMGKRKFSFSLSFITDHVLSAVLPWKIQTLFFILSRYRNRRWPLGNSHLQGHIWIMIYCDIYVYILYINARIQVWKIYAVVSSPRPFYALMKASVSLGVKYCNFTMIISLVANGMGKHSLGSENDLFFTHLENLTWNLTGLFL